MIASVPVEIRTEHLSNRSQRVLPLDQRVQFSPHKFARQAHDFADDRILRKYVCAICMLEILNGGRSDRHNEFTNSILKKKHQDYEQYHSFMNDSTALCWALASSSVS
jgi:hypothetical protein